MSHRVHCDFCDQWTTEALDWYQVEKDDIIRTMSEGPWETKHFCCITCLRRWATIRDDQERQRRGQRGS